MAKANDSAPARTADGGHGRSPDGAPKLKRKRFEEEVERLHVELVKLQEYVKARGLRVVVIFEGRDAAGKGGVIKTITQDLNPRVCRVAALPAPSDRQRTQWYFQRYVAELPSGAKWRSSIAVGTTARASSV
jgi:polyphosphate kinase 2 (PPK2 family)